MNKLKGAIAVFVLLVPFVANALPIVNTGLCDDGVNTCYTSIRNLEVGGLLYDVDWYSTGRLLSDLLISDPGVATFSGSPPSALAAASAINTVFNDDGNLFNTIDTDSSGFVGLWVVSNYTDVRFDFLVPFSSSDTVNGASRPIATRIGPFTIFTQVNTVPLPSSLLLLGLGIAGMGLVKRRKEI